MKKIDTRAVFMKIPKKCIESKNDKTVSCLIYCFINMNRFLNKSRFSIYSFMEWCGVKYDVRKDKVNQSFLDAFVELIDLGVISTDIDFSKFAINKHNFDKLLTFEINDNMFETKDNFALVYLDEILKILHLSQNTKSVKILDVFRVLAYLRYHIPKRNNYDADKKLIEAYMCFYRDISEYLNMSEKRVSNSIKVLKELEIIHLRHIRKRCDDKDGNKWRTFHTIFANSYSRKIKNNSVESELSGEEYYLPEIKMLMKLERFEFLFGAYCIAKKKYSRFNTDEEESDGFEFETLE